MWKLSKGLSNFFNYYFNQKFSYAFSLDCKNDRNLIGCLSIKCIDKFCKPIAICINNIKTQMYNPEIIDIFISKNTIDQAISVYQIHKTTDLITILRSKSLILYS